MTEIDRLLAAHRHAHQADAPRVDVRLPTEEGHRTADVLVSASDIESQPGARARSVRAR